MTQYEGADKVPALMLANTTPRYQRLEALESWVQGTQYNARACDWFDDKVPLWERKPCIVYPAVSLAIESYVDLMFGEKRFPAFTEENFWAIFLPLAIGFLCAWVFGAVVHEITLAFTPW